MIEARHQAGDSFSVQFVWRLPDDDYIRALFEARVLALDAGLDRYLLRLERLIAGRQELPDGQPRPIESLEGGYWPRVQGLVGKRIYLAYEVDDGRPMLLRLATLTGEHSFFTRLDEMQTQAEDEAG